MERPDPVDIEKVFSQFVVDIGGKIVADMLPKYYDKPNADFYFPNPEIISELKCLQKDSFNTEEDAERIVRLVDKWVKQKLVNRGDELKIFFGQLKLPSYCYNELVTLVRRLVDKVIHHANKQIGETKKELNIPHAKGLLLIANDGNYFLQNQNMLSLIVNLMGTKYMGADVHIDGVVYFTVNQTAFIPDSDLDWQLWVPSYRKDGDVVLGNFVNKIGHDFYHIFLPKVTGRPISDGITPESNKEAIEKIRDMKYVPKKYTFKKE